MDQIYHPAASLSVLPMTSPLSPYPINTPNQLIQPFANMAMGAQFNNVMYPQMLNSVYPNQIKA